MSSLMNDYLCLNLFVTTTNSTNVKCHVMLHILYQAVNCIHKLDSQSATGRHAILEFTKNALNTRVFSFSNFVAPDYTYETARTFL